MSDARGFFSIDRGAFRCAAARGLNSAVAHLVMTRGTGRDNRTTQWSVHSIERHTGISRPNAAKAVKDLVDRGIWKKSGMGATQSMRRSSPPKFRVVLQSHSRFGSRML
jgi:hypothetical protein